MAYCRGRDRNCIARENGSGRSEGVEKHLERVHDDEISACVIRIASMDRTIKPHSRDFDHTVAS